MVSRHVEPAHQKQAFTCPRCETLATQVWSVVSDNGSIWQHSRCQACNLPTLWERTGEDGGVEQWQIAYPDASLAPSPNDDMPHEVKSMYQEASSVLNRSPKAAAALLRLALQLLCVHLGQPGKNINDDIASLVKSKNLRPMIQQALDVVRIAGNESVHPGEINLDDDHDLAIGLFRLLNIIVNEMISLPKDVQAMYDKMPPAKVAAVAKRDGAPVAASASAP